jgi:hypothetical protein
MAMLSPSGKPPAPSPHSVSLFGGMNLWGVVILIMKYYYGLPESFAEYQHPIFLQWK